MLGTIDGVVDGEDIVGSSVGRIVGVKEGLRVGDDVGVVVGHTKLPLHSSYAIVVSTSAVS